MRRVYLSKRLNSCDNNFTFTMTFRIYFILLLLFGSTIYTARGEIKSCAEIQRVFAKQLLTQLGNGSAVSTEDVSSFFSDHFLKLPSVNSLPMCFTEATDGISSVQERCLLDKCLSAEDMLELSGICMNTTHADVSTLALILLHSLESKVCAEKKIEAPTDKHPAVTATETWGYGLVCTTVIVLATLCGLLALPFVHGVCYKRLLLYMVGLAVGTLAGSSLLFLLPEALELTEEELNVDSFIWKCLVMIAAIYVFFIVERVLKIVTVWREQNKRERILHQDIQGGRFASLDPDTKYGGPKFKDLDTLPAISSFSSCRGPCGSNDTNLTNMSETPPGSGSIPQRALSETANNYSEESEVDLQHVAPVAWMIIFGDGLHNFVDGVSIGAAFTTSILGGVSVSVAILCEELPHELGDFAVLLNAGMSKKRAALFNFLSACTIYIGMVVGIFLGENVEAHTWVFAFAGGMFLYIALVDMMPAMCAAGESEENKKLIGTGWIFLLQNLGILSGFGVMLILAIYGGELESAITGKG